MSVASVLTSIGLSSFSTRGIDRWGHSTLKALMVLPTWSLARWLGWPEFVAVGCICLLVLALAVVTGCRIQ